MNDKIKQLLEASKEVIADCSLTNGAIVAANSTKPYFPKEAKNYYFVWPRDGMYTCLAANLVGINDIQEKFFKWCMEAQEWSETGLFYEKYFIDGRKVRHNFQPDQTGSVLIALFDYYKNKKDCSFEQLIKNSADALCKIWNKNHFKLVTQDLWEEKLCFPDMEENFTYSLAICCRGLFCANELIPTPRWMQTAEEMKSVLLNQFNGYFYRSFGKMNDTRVDASLLGLVWPAELVDANDDRMKKTVKLIEEKLVSNQGVHRYEHDEYDGWMYKQDINRKKGAGYWPILNFWLSIYFLKCGDREKAEEYYHKVIDDMKDKKYIPEQVFNNELQISVSPLCWSHAMWVISSKRLGYIKFQK